MLLTDLPSSFAQTLIVSGWPTVAERGPDVIPPGPAPSGPFAANLSTGGVFPDPASPWSASISQFGCRLPGIAHVSPRILIVQTTLFLSPKSAGTFTAKTPQCRFGSKCVGCP